MLEVIDRILAWIRLDLKRESLRYWLTAIVVLTVSIWATPYVNTYLRLDQLRYGIFQRMTELAGGHYLKPKFGRVVLIEDDDFWDGDLEHRLPTNRFYLAKLVHALDAAAPYLIGLDFDVRLPHENAPGTPGDYHELDKDYRDETEALIHAIDDVAQRRRIVLAKTIVGPPGAYRSVADIYQPYGLCTAMRPDGSWDNPGTKEFPLSAVAAGNISCGYIALPFDVLRLPLMVDLGKGRKLDSFALAIARAWDANVAADIATDDYFGSFIPPGVMRKFSPPISAHQVLAHDDSAARRLAGKLVIVGSGWHTRAYEAGGDAGLVDRHGTPIGSIGGAELHDNFVEAILSGRVSSVMKPWATDALEVAFGIMAALVFAFFERIWTKLAVLAALLVALLLAQWAMLTMFYTYFEALVPLLSLAVHSIFARLLEEKA